MIKVNSEHFPAVLACGKGDIRYVVNEYIEAADSVTSISHEELVKQSVEILDELFNAGVINRDVNHENLLLSKTGKLILIDFGWAVFADEGFRPSGHENIEAMLNKRYRAEDGSFDDAYSLYRVLRDYYHVDEVLLDKVKSRIGRLCIKGIRN